MNSENMYELCRICSFLLTFLKLSRNLRRFMIGKYRELTYYRCLLLKKSHYVCTSRLKLKQNHENWKTKGLSQKNSKSPKKPVYNEIYLSSPGGGGVLESLRLLGLPIFSFFCTKIQSKISPSISLKIKPCHRHQDPTDPSSTCWGQWSRRWRNGCVRYTGKNGKNRTAGSENAFFPDQNKRRGLHMVRLLELCSILLSE